MEKKIRGLKEKSIILKINVIISQPRHMLLVLKRTAAMSSAERSKAEVLLLLIHCLLWPNFLFFVGEVILVLVLLCITECRFYSLGKKKRERESKRERVSCFVILFDCYCSVSLPRGAMR